MQQQKQFHTELEKSLRKKVESDALVFVHLENLLYARALFVVTMQVIDPFRIAGKVDLKNIVIHPLVSIVVIHFAKTIYDFNI